MSAIAGICAAPQGPHWKFQRSLRKSWPMAPDYELLLDAHMDNHKPYAFSVLQCTLPTGNGTHHEVPKGALQVPCLTFVCVLVVGTPVEVLTNGETTRKRCFGTRQSNSPRFASLCSRPCSNRHRQLNGRSLVPNVGHGEKPTGPSSGQRLTIAWTHGHVEPSTG